MPMTPKAFVSYSWESETHKRWVRDLAERLRQDGVDVMLDHWHLAPGDQLTHFMEKAVADNDYVIVVCTPRYKEKSDSRIGGVGYEGDIMTAEIFHARNRRKFIPIQRSGNWNVCAPLWLVGSYFIDLSGNPYSENNYKELVHTIHNMRSVAPPVGPAPAKLIVRFDNTKEFIQNVKVDTPDLDERFHCSELYPATFVRLRIENKTREMIKGCSAYLVGVERKDNGAFTDVFYSSGQRLNWELEQGGGLDGVKNIYEGTHKYLDVFFTYKMPNKEGIRFRLYVQTYDFEQIWNVSGVYRLTIRISAENAAAQDVKLIFGWNKKWDDFSIIQEG